MLINIEIKWIQRRINNIEGGSNGFPKSKPALLGIESTTFGMRCEPSNHWSIHIPKKFQEQQKCSKRVKAKV